MNNVDTPIVERETGVRHLIGNLYCQSIYGAFKLYTINRRSHRAFLIFSVYKANGRMGIYPPQRVNGLEVFRHELRIKGK